MTKILLVEDDKSLREIYGVRLLAEGYDIVSAGDGEEALAMAIKERPQLIVSDVMMPKISGFDMLDILRSTTETKDIKVIMMTALSSEDQRERGESLGADRYLVKSQVGIEDVVRTVHEVLGDSPTAGAVSANAFTQPTPTVPVTPGAPRPATAAPQRPAATGVPVPPPRPQAAPQLQQPATPAPQPIPAPVASPMPPAPAASKESNLPQPTAPFSTNRPGNLGDRVIHPIDGPHSNKPDIGNLMAEELSSAAPNTAPVTPSVPTPPVPPTPQPTASPTPPITFEETPLSPKPAGTQPPRQ
jgi:CheY-like chemotaxis protein